MLNVSTDGRRPSTESKPENSYLGIRSIVATGIVTRMGRDPLRGSGRSLEPGQRVAIVSTSDNAGLTYQPVGPRRAIAIFCI